MRSLTRPISSFNVPHPLDGHTRVPRKRPVALAAHLCSQRGAKACGIFSFVRRERPLSSRPRGLEEQSADFRHSFAFNEVSKLAQDASTALATIREWRNSFVPVNRIPVDVLSLIPTHLSSQRDRFYASFVCRHWRRTFLHNAALWSQLYLLRGEVYVKALLERAKGSALDITVNDMDPVRAMALLPPHTKQIRSLDFTYNHWANIQRFSEVNSGPLPLLTTLKINAVNEFNLEGRDDMTPPSIPLFSNAVNLKEFFLESEGAPFLGNFAFPNLTTFKLLAMPEDFRLSHLLDFLEASPMLRTVGMKIVSNMVFGDIPRERIVVLPNVETFGIIVNDSGSGYELAAHMSCPSARYTSLMHEPGIEEATRQEILPTPGLWNAIVHQYSRSPVEEVTLKIQIAPDPTIACSLTFRSPDATVIKLGFKVDGNDESDDEPSEDMQYQVFSQASRIIRDHPLVANVRRLHIGHSSDFLSPIRRRLIAHEVGQILRATGPLEELTIDSCDLRSYLLPFLDLPGPSGFEPPVAFPPVKVLTVLHPMPVSREECMGVIVRLAKSQHALGVLLERVVVRRAELPNAMAEELRPWVGEVDCCEEPWIL